MEINTLDWKRNEKETSEEYFIEKNNSLSIDEKQYFSFHFIQQGKGYQEVNEKKIKFKPNDIFLVTGLHQHKYQATATTKIIAIKFSSHYINWQTHHITTCPWFQSIEKHWINFAKNQQHQIKYKEKQKIKMLFSQLKKDDLLQNNLIQQSIEQNTIQLIVNLLTQESPYYTTVTRNINQEKIFQISNYIQQHITQKQKLSIPEIAKNNQISPNYLTEFFKSQSGKTIKEYIILTKLDLVQKKLSQGLVYKEIAHELDFSSVAHLKKIQKKYNQTIS